MHPPKIVSIWACAVTLDCAASRLLLHVWNFLGFKNPSDLSFAFLRLLANSLAPMGLLCCWVIERVVNLDVLAVLKRQCEVASAKAWVDYAIYEGAAKT
jgi:hypothetical protein